MTEKILTGVEENGYVTIINIDTGVIKVKFTNL